jgi:hypothetical protein
MKIKFTDEEDFFMFSSRHYAQDSKEKPPAPAKEQYEPKDKKRIKSKDDFKVQRSMKRGEQ